MKNEGFVSKNRFGSWALRMGAFGALVLLSGCGNKNLCVDRNVRCDSPLTCDPQDGVCKCGGRGGVVCGTGFVCDAASNTCQGTRCGSVSCVGGTSCDLNDGICKCGGTGGTECATGEVCNPSLKACVPALDCSSILCGQNQTCDPATGRCLCGGQACASGQTCSIAGASGERTCVDNLCAGVACVGSNACDPADGYCKCNGVICQNGEACACPLGADGGSCLDSQRVCRPTSNCGSVTCSGGTTCDPVDGQCKCGGAAGPVCSSEQLCALGPPSQCQGGQQCLLADGGTKTCAGGTSCDPEDGACKCGGRGGQACSEATLNDPAEICVATAQQKACRRPCDPRTPDCPAGTYCYFDPTAATPAAYCTAPADSRKEGQACTTAASCFVSNPPASLHCTGLVTGSSGLCRPYCDVQAGSSGCLQVPQAQSCVQIPDAPSGYGFCQPQSQ